LRIINTPMSRQPDTLMVHVDQGKPSGRCGHATEMPYRASAPAAPPVDTAAITGHGLGRARLGRV
jgi:hypothetical protein